MRHRARIAYIGWLTLILGAILVPPTRTGAVQAAPRETGLLRMPTDPDAGAVGTASGVAAEALIILKPGETGNYKLVNLIELARLVNSAGPDGFHVQAGTTFSFLGSGLMAGDYVLGWNTAHDLVPGGGICAGSSLIATLVTEADRRGAPVAVTGRVRHITYEPAYHQVNIVGGRTVPVVDAAVNDSRPTQDFKWANRDRATYAFRVFLLMDPGDGNLIPVDEARIGAEYRRDPLGPISRPVYFYGRLTRLP